MSSIILKKFEKISSNKNLLFADTIFETEKGGEKVMAIVPSAKEALNRFKMEAANEVGVNLKQGYNGDLTSRQAGSIGGQMVKKMIMAYENNLSR